MFASFNLVMLAALRDGFLLFDRGAWRERQRGYEVLVGEGLLISEGRGWRWTEGAEERLRAVLAASASS